MSLLVIHLRWDGADEDHGARLARVLPPVGLATEAPCVHRRAWREGSRVLSIEVWRDEEAARTHLDGLPLDAAAVGLEPPTVAVMVFPDAYRAVLPLLVGTTAGTSAPRVPVPAR